MSSSESQEPDSLRPAHLDDFFAECDEHFTTARQILLGLDENELGPQADRAKLEELFRAFHSVKGLSAMVGLRPAEELAHHMENYLGLLRERRLVCDAPGISALIAGVSHLESIVDAYRTNAALPSAGSVVEDLKSLLVRAGEKSSAELGTTSPAIPVAIGKLDSEQTNRIAAAIRAGQFAWWVRFTPSTGLAERRINVNSVRQELQSIGKLVYSAPQIPPDGRITFVFLVLTAGEKSPVAGREADGLSCSAYAPQPAASAHETSPASPAPISRSAPGLQAGSPTNVVRVGLGRLDELMRMVGDLVITRARFEQNLKHMVTQLPAPQWRVLQENNAAFERQIRDLREGIMRARLVPIRDTFSRMQFIVRDLTREFDKAASVQMHGGETEVDKFIVERVMDPLLHLVRNAVSHGIESSAERIGAGKSPAGRIALTARTDGQTIIIEVEDDGRGIDRHEIFSRAERLGLVSAASNPEDLAILDVLCAPGFSTRDSVDRTSGRGVGMNVVKSAVEELSGRLSLFTEQGRGTRFTIQLPLTLSIADALIFDVGNQTFALPQSWVQEVFEFEPESISILENNEIVMRRGSALPLVRLAALFGLSARPGQRRYALIVGESRAAVGLVVDRLLGLHEIVVRPLTDPLVRVTGISGVTELGDGRLALILDPAGVIRAAATPGRARTPVEIGLANTSSLAATR